MPSPAAAKIPLATMDWIVQSGGIVPMRAPITVLDRHYAHLEYDASGEQIWVEEEANLFPTDVFVVFTEGMPQPLVLLARSPHGGCLIRWDAENEYFEEPCYGSRFTLEGEYFFGPAPRDLDRLPSEVRDGVLWILGTIVHGEEHPQCGGEGHVSSHRRTRACIARYGQFARRGWARV